METPDIAQFARNFSVMIRTQGPDPKGLKMRKHAFHLHKSGVTTLSASGLLLPPGSLTDPPRIFEHIMNLHGYCGALVVTVASVIEPFLTARHRENPTQEFPPKLIADACIDILVEGKKEGSSHDEPTTSPCWLPSQLLALVDVSAASDALLLLVGAHGVSHEQASWEIGWSLASLNNDLQTRIEVGNSIRPSVETYRNSLLDESNSSTFMAKSATRIALLGVATEDLKDVLHIDISQPQKKGDFLFVMGSPFGLLSPLHFYNSISVGAVANCCPPGSNRTSLMMADIRCLPGMEGSPVFDKHGLLTGILTRPLRQKGGSAEIQLVISWNAITTTLNGELQKKTHNVHGGLIDGSNSIQRSSLYSSSNFRRSVNCLIEGPEFPSVSPSSLEKAISSIALVTVGDGAWASGIVLNNCGLVLTNAHVLEPWKSGRASLLGKMDKTTTSFVKYERPFSNQTDNEVQRSILFPAQLGSPDTSVVNGHEASFLNFNYKRNYQKISVRLAYTEHQIWYDAKVVYISKGPWDVALLQLESFQKEVCAITPEFACPSKGSTVYVIGHGLLGPQSDISPSVSSGVLSSIVRIPGPVHHHESSITRIVERNMPVMLQTTAAVHPGASGGAVVNSDGRMIGLVTSNARHGGGALIPHLNFSIPCVALEPIFKFADKQDLSFIQVLDEPNELLSSVWTLLSRPSPVPESLLKKSKDEKGSRFSQFLADKHAELDPLKDKKNVIHGKIPSKI